MMCDDITAKVAELLGDISKAGGYKTDCGSAVRDQLAVDPDARDLPCINVDYEDVELPEDADGGIVGMVLMIEIFSRPQMKVSDIVTDAMKVLKKNKDLDGLAAEFYPLGSRKVSEQGQYRINYALLRFRVYYPTADAWEF